MKSFFLTLFLFCLSGMTLAAPPPKVPLRMEISDISYDPQQGLIVLPVNFDIDKGWHIYWHTSGDTGIGTSFSLTPPAEIFTTSFPSPSRFKLLDMNEFGYEGNVTIKLNVRLEKEASLTLTAHIVACKNECLPLKMRKDIHINPNELPFTSIEEFPLPPLEAGYYEKEDKIILDIEVEDLFAFDDKIVTYDKPEKKEGYAVFLKSEDFKEGSVLRGLAKFPDGSFREIAADLREAPPKEQEHPGNILLILFLSAFAGGVILNLMPCVFPILSLKAFSLIRSKDSSFNKKSAVFYTLGILSAFALLSLVIIMFKKASSFIGWGFQLQNPYFVAFLAILFFLLGLSFLGFYNITLFVPSYSRKNRFLGSFLTGLLAVAVASPCSTPFLGVAMGATLSLNSNFLALMTFLTAGLGLAFPYLLISFSPYLAGKLPNPGKWMITFQQFLSFPLFMTTIWLLWVLKDLEQQDFIISSLGLMLLFTFCIWLYKNLFRKTVLAIFLALIVSAFAMIFDRKEDRGIIWYPYSPETFSTLIEDNRKMFLKFTAKWCLVCLANEKLVLETKETADLFRRNGVKAVVADWTTKDEDITMLLKSYGRISIPLYVYYDGTGSYTILPQILTGKTLQSLIEP